MYLAWLTASEGFNPGCFGPICLGSITAMGLASEERSWGEQSQQGCAL